MNIDVVRSDTVTVLVPDGPLDLAVADTVRKTLTDLIDGGQSRLVLDLGAVDYVDSSGLGALVASMKHARTVGGDLKLCAIQPDVRAILEMTRLVKVVSIYATRPEAVASWG